MPCWRITGSSVLPNVELAGAKLNNSPEICDCDPNNNYNTQFYNEHYSHSHQSSAQSQPPNSSESSARQLQRSTAAVSWKTLF